MQDGVGAQAIRLIGINSLCNYYKTHYLHSPISKVQNREELTGGDMSDNTYQSLLQDLRKLTFLDDTSVYHDTKRKVFYEHNIGRKKLLLYLLLSIVYRLIGVRLILSLTLPFGIVDRQPELWELGATQMRKNLNQFKYSTRNSLVLHYRTSQHSPIKSRPQLTSNYYMETLQQYLLSGDIKSSSILIHTDLQEDDMAVANLTDRVEDFQKFLDFCKKGFEKVEVRHYAPIFDALLDMIFSETLIVSNSAMSYFAGILNVNQVIFPPKHGHSKLPRWKLGSNTSESLRIFKY
jgi:hypothetical protein